MDKQYTNKTLMETQNKKLEAEITIKIFDGYTSVQLNGGAGHILHGLGYAMNEVLKDTKIVQMNRIKWVIDIITKIIEDED